MQHFSEKKKKKNIHGNTSLFFLLYYLNVIFHILNLKKKKKRKLVDTYLCGFVDRFFFLKKSKTECLLSHLWVGFD